MPLGTPTEIWHSSQEEARYLVWLSWMDGTLTASPPDYSPPDNHPCYSLHRPPPDSLPLPFDTVFREHQ